MKVLIVTIPVKKKKYKKSETSPRVGAWKQFGVAVALLKWHGQEQEEQKV